MWESRLASISQTEPNGVSFRPCLTAGSLGLQRVYFARRGGVARNPAELGRFSDLARGRLRSRFEAVSEGRSPDTMRLGKKALKCSRTLAFSG
jgi:hypothetical protein